MLACRKEWDAVLEDTRTIHNADEVVESVLGSERLGLGSCSGESQGWKLQVRNLPQNTEFAIFRGYLAPGELWEAAGNSPLLCSFRFNSAVFKGGFSLQRHLQVRSRQQEKLHCPGESGQAG